MTLQIGVAGITGRMGRLVVEEIARAGERLVGGVRQPGGVEEAGVLLVSDIGELAHRSDVVIDFTVATAVAAHASALADASCQWVLGTSGLTSADEALVATAAAKIPIVFAANFSPAVTVMLAFAERLARALPAGQYDAEILEMHHRQKADAPSGTALALGRAVAIGRGVALEDVMQAGRRGNTGARKPGEIGFASLRGGQVVGEHTLLFAGADEHISLTHRAFDRRIYATGAVAAAEWLATRPAGLYSMRDVLGLDSSTS